MQNYTTETTITRSAEICGYNLWKFTCHLCLWIKQMCSYFHLCVQRLQHYVVPYIMFRYPRQIHLTLLLVIIQLITLLFSPSSLHSSSPIFYSHINPVKQVRVEKHGFKPASPRSQSSVLTITPHQLSLPLLATLKGYTVVTAALQIWSNDTNKQGFRYIHIQQPLVTAL